MRHTRRKFLATTLTVLATSALSCGGGGGDEGSDGLTPPTDVDCLSNGAGAMIGGAAGAHRHLLSVPPEDVRAGVDKTYVAQSPSTHPHSVTLTADHFASLQANQSVSVGVTTWTSPTSGNQHSHNFAVISCS